MLWIVALVLAGGLFSGFGAGIIGLLLALEFFLLGAGIKIANGQFLLILCLVLAVPTAALLAGVLLDKVAHAQINGRAFSSLAVAIAFCLAFSSDAFIDYFEAAWRISAQASIAKNFTLFIALGNAIVFCAGLTAFCLLLLVLVFELPIVWMQSMSGYRAALALQGLRPLAILLLGSLAINHIAGLFVAELWPTAFLSKLGG